MTQAGIYKMLEELSNHHRDKSQLTKLFIQSRLDKSVATYSDDLAKSYASLKQKNEMHILRKLNKV